MEERSKATTRPGSGLVDLLAVVEQAADAIGIDDLHGNVVWGNRAFRRLFGLADDEPLGTLADYVPVRAREGLLRRHRDRVQGPLAPASYEFEARRRDGSRLWVEATVAPVVDDGVTTGTCAVIRDVTVRRRRELELDQAQQQYRSLFERAASLTTVPVRSAS